MKTSPRNLVMCALCAAIICILSPVSVPIGPVPISLATFAVMLAGVLLGAKWGTIATAVYILLGAVGVPVFASYSAGVGVLFGTTGGYIFGYILLAFVAGLVYDRLGRHTAGVMKYVWAVVGMLLGTVVLYVLGTIWFYVSYNANASATMGQVLAWCVTPFLIGDTVKIIVVAAVVPQIERALNKAGVGFESEATAKA